MAHIVRIMHRTRTAVEHESVDTKIDKKRPVIAHICSIKPRTRHDLQHLSNIIPHLSDL